MDVPPHAEQKDAPGRSEYVFSGHGRQSSCSDEPLRSLKAPRGQAWADKDEQRQARASRHQMPYLSKGGLKRAKVACWAYIAEGVGVAVDGTVEPYTRVRHLVQGHQGGIFFPVDGEFAINALIASTSEPQIRVAVGCAFQAHKPRLAIEAYRSKQATD